MPELPEVESVRKGLEKLIQQAVIQEAEVFWDRIIALPEDANRFKQAIKGEQIVGISRRGKFLLFHLTSYTLISHLRMEGKFRVTEEDEPLSKHTHVVFHLQDGRELRYADVRKFGRMLLVPKGTENDVPSLRRLGPEPIEEAFDQQSFSQALKRRKKSIKAVLLDQTAVAGLGNIYVDEVLFQAAVRPDRAASSLSKEDITHLHRAIIQTMKQAVEAGGTTIRTYENAFGENGTYQQALNVYGRQGKPCVRCGTTIEKKKVAQRGTHYCPHCQV
ncbi:DNA-formamidopyrimidine glycosylase [Atopococcus tabaci]|uniref:DNA-formamidopyrimidine glycosylase n=1 Tax=Atopococcus tabaci TaxID=269774 RepID=UPI0003FE2155|nr:DNA-formamidopyrimidine glycosylase [Atopococcus tabaci]